MLKIPRALPNQNNNDKTPIKTGVSFKSLPKHSANVNCLKPFDTAFIAYYMMGLGNL
ncbi:hypothetical protein NSTC745_01575 [Nostoc sp. DSM 114161]|uniref:hypothetical protein n=1 Tax=Nostoc sp. DSM 114161 TaxID=3440143 RepID=UPI0040455C4B